MDLRDKKILVVEDDFYLADDICGLLKGANAKVLGPAPTVFFAFNLLSSRRIDGAILDVRLHRETVYELADELSRRNVPFLLATAIELEELPERFRKAPYLQKPYRLADLAAAIETLLQPPLAAPIALQDVRGGEPMTELLLETMARHAGRLARATDRTH